MKISNLTRPQRNVFGQNILVIGDSLRWRRLALNPRQLNNSRSVHNHGGSLSYIQVRWSRSHVPLLGRAVVSWWKYVIMLLVEQGERSRQNPYFGR